MAVFAIANFASFAGLLVAGGKLATDPNPINRLKALADLAANTTTLAAVLRDTGLAPLAAEMTRAADETARHFTHPGTARDDAIALFWQVAPDAFADPAALAAADLDPGAATERMIAAIRASPHARDFFATRLPEQLFRQVAHKTLSVMLAKADYIATITPDLWRETLRRHGVVIELLREVRENTAEILALVRELHAIKNTTVPEDTLIAMARKINPRIADRDEALRALDAAADLAAEAMARGESGSNIDAFVDSTLRRLAALTAKGELDAAAAAADSAVEQAKAGHAQLIDAAITQRLLAFDPEGAARQILQRLMLATSDPSGLFTSLQRAGHDWRQRGNDHGRWIDLEVSIALARLTVTWARNPGQRCDALDNLGGALLVLGERAAGTARLEEALAIFRTCLDECPRAMSPLGWATTQANTGIALLRLGEREDRADRMEEAIRAFCAALTEIRRERDPCIWADTLLNLGSALRILGERNGDPFTLRKSLLASRKALKVYAADGDSVQWSSTKHNIGNALEALYRLERDPARIRDAVAAYRDSLGAVARDLDPRRWANTQNSLGNGLVNLSEQENEQDGAARLKEAIAAFDCALDVFTSKNDPLLHANSTGNQGLALYYLGEQISDLEMAKRALIQLTEAEAALRDGVHALWADNFAAALPAVRALVARLSA